ncbi:MAG TPA: hypothetical protein VK256_15605 [Candidatus Eisenbacteria bacterium]|nr:hypothetical protein [Candidatus Eisenbacteria bacterium]
MLTAIREYRAREVDPSESEDDLKRLRSIIDALKAELATQTARAVQAVGGDDK